MTPHGHRTLLAMLAGSLLLALAAPGQAGTADAPEVTDAANDQVLVETIPGCLPAAGCAGATRIDILAAWIDEETASTFNVNIQLSAAPGGATAASARWEFHASSGGTEVVATATAAGGATVGGPVPGQNVAAAAADGNVLVLTIEKSVYAQAGAGSALTGLYVAASSLSPPPTPGVEYASDRAPDSGFGTDYVFTGGGSGADPSDTDQDGLNDTLENRTFGGLGQNGTGDPDGDGLNNSREFTLGTNATLADTDGDGVDDGEDPAPLDPSVPPPNATADRDEDGLPDAYETEQFNSTTAQTGAGDPDDDGLNNTQEHGVGTDPNVADTDGDGLDDGEDDDPLVPNAASTERLDATARLELRAGALLFAAAATFCLLGLARGI